MFIGLNSCRKGNRCAERAAWYFRHVVLPKTAAQSTERPAELFPRTTPHPIRQSYPLLLTLPLVVCSIFCEAAEGATSASTARLSFAADEIGGTAISRDGRLAAFVAGVTNAAATVPNQRRVPTVTLNVFVCELSTGETTMVSVSDDGHSPADGHSNYPSFSADGRFILFESLAGNLVTNDFNRTNDIFLRELATDRTVLISVSAQSGIAGNGPSTRAVMTPDARYIAFESFANDLASDDTNAIKDVFVRDVEVAKTVTVSQGARAIDLVRSASEYPAISANGQVVAFTGRATGLVPGVANGSGELYVRDLATRTTIRVSEPWPSTSILTESFNPVLSADGRYLVFKTYVPGRACRILWRDLLAGTNVFVATNLPTLRSGRRKRHFRNLFAGMLISFILPRRGWSWVRTLRRKPPSGWCVGFCADRALNITPRRCFGPLWDWFTINITAFRTDPFAAQHSQ